MKNTIVIVLLLSVMLWPNWTLESEGEGEEAYISVLEHYGPHPDNYDALIGDTFNFDQVTETLGDETLVHHLGHMEQEQATFMLLASIPKGLRQDAAKAIVPALSFAEYYQIDPFWVLAVMWTESHFQQDAKSYKNAVGLMQIMPGTSYFLADKMKLSVTGRREAYRLARNPEVNIGMGVHYLDHLLDNFDGNFCLATVAYNMGPGMVRYRLRKGLAVGIKNQYLTRVINRYKTLTKPFLHSIQDSPSPPHHPPNPTPVAKQKYSCTNS